MSIGRTDHIWSLCVIYLQSVSKQELMKSGCSTYDCMWMTLARGDEYSLLTILKKTLFPFSWQLYENEFQAQILETDSQTMQSLAFVVLEIYNHFCLSFWNWQNFSWLMIRYVQYLYTLILSSFLMYSDKSTKLIHNWQNV